MKILFLMDSLGAGGAERSTADLWYFLREAGIEIHVVLLGHRKPGIEEEIISAGFDILFLKRGGVLSQSKAIAERIESLKPDIVHSVLFKSNLRTRLARLRTKFLYVESLVNCSYDKIRLKDPHIGKAAFYFYKYLDKFTVFLVDHFHSITYTVKDHYVQELKVDPSKISVVYRGRNPIPPIVLERTSIGFTNDDFLIISTGRQEFQKGQIFLIQAIHHLLKGGYSDIKLLILGRDGNASGSIKKYIAEHGLSENVILGGYRSDATQILSIGDLFAFPSLYEGLGGALIEAQAAGLPVVCNDLPVLREVIVEGQNAKTFSSENITSIAEAILFFYRNTSLRRTFGTKSRENFEKKFNLAQIHNEMLQLYKKLVRDRNVSHKSL